MNRLTFKLGAIATLALGVLALSAGAALAKSQPVGKNGVIYACFKAQGKNKGALRVVPTANGCRKLHGWRPVSWSAIGSSGAGGQSGSQGANGAGGNNGAAGSQGSAGPEGKEGQQGAASTVEKSLLETVNTQTSEINSLTKQVTDLADEVLNLEGDVTNGLLDLEGDLSNGLLDMEGNVTDLGDELLDVEKTVGETCTQLTAVTKQANEILTSLLGSSVAVLGNLINVPSPPGQLGAFKCN